MRVSSAMLESRIEILNESMGRPCASYKRNEDGSLTADIGNFHLYHPGLTIQGDTCHD